MDGGLKDEDFTFGLTYDLSNADGRSDYEPASSHEAAVQVVKRSIVVLVMCLTKFIQI